MFWCLCTNFGLVWILVFVKASVLLSLTIVLLDWKHKVFCSFPYNMKITLTLSFVDGFYSKSEGIFFPMGFLYTYI